MTNMLQKIFGQIETKEQFDAYHHRQSRRNSVLVTW